MLYASHPVEASPGVLLRPAEWHVFACVTVDMCRLHAFLLFEPSILYCYVLYYAVSV